jgi:hypothetical protein
LRQSSAALSGHAVVAEPIDGIEIDTFVEHAAP